MSYIYFTACEESQKADDICYDSLSYSFVRKYQESQCDLLDFGNSESLRPMYEISQ